jgi:uncharacterized protein YdiU (UPF0061 family)
LFGEQTQDENLINDLLIWMNQNKADYTNTFCSLMKEDIKKEKLFQNLTFVEWYKRWSVRITKNKKPSGLSLNLMRANNPLVIPRNHKVEETLNAASNNANLMPLHDLLKYLKKPYENQPEISNYQTVPESNGKIYKTFCGT